jgi:DNA-binding NtrC family response regulator
MPNLLSPRDQMAPGSLDLPRIFVVDDERMISASLAMILRMKGFDARAFVDPLEALEACRLHAPDLLISDVLMPEMTGVELALKLKEMCPDCKVLLFSGQAKTVDLLEKARAEGYDFELLTKPVHPKDLIARAQALTQ